MPGLRSTLWRDLRVVAAHLRLSEHLYLCDASSISSSDDLLRSLSSLFVGRGHIGLSFDPSCSWTYALPHARMKGEALVC